MNKTIGIFVAIILVLAAVYFFWFNRGTDLGSLLGSRDEVNQTPPPAPTPSPTPTPPSGVPAPSFKKIRIISPKAGEVWTRNKNYLVRWDTSSITSAESAFINLIPTTKGITDFYAAKYTGIEMFNSGVYPSGFPPEGSFSYTVPQSLKAGTYQIVVLVGKNCNTDIKVRCVFDTSDGLITIK